MQPGSSLPNLDRHSNPKKLYPPAPTPQGTATILGGLLFAYLSYPSETTPTAMANVAAINIGISFLVSAWFDSQKGLHNLLRTDLLCFVSIYSLTLAEFLFPQSIFDAMATTTETKLAIDIVLLGIGSMAVGRHLVAAKPMTSSWLNLTDISSQSVFRIFIISAFLAYIYMFLSVQFDPIALFQGLTGPRFTQPWGRGAFGDWKALLYELNLLSYILPPLTGVILNRRANFSKVQLITIMIIFLFTLFTGFATGTRNIFIAYTLTFLMGYLITLPKHTLINTMIPIILTMAISTYASTHMLAFRGVGLQNYIMNKAYTRGSQTLSIDYNLASLGKVANTLPRKHDFLGPEVLIWALIKPIPRALWPEKPKGLSVSIESIMGAEGYTVAATYLGESYMMSGMLGVIGMSVFFGAAAAWWNRMAMQKQSDYALLVFALGFFAAGLTMRSFFWLTTAILPVIALIVFRKFALR
jgi:hypothetical protein